MEEKRTSVFEKGLIWFGAAVSINIQNLIIWLVGFVIYRMLMRVDILVGNTLPDMVITILLCILASKGFSFPNKKTA